MKKPKSLTDIGIGFGLLGVGEKPDNPIAPNRILLIRDGDPGWAGTDALLDAESAKQIVEAFAGQGVDLVVDYEHASVESEKTFNKAPAAGWVKALEYVTGEGLYATVEWTDAARQEIETKQYKYFSPTAWVEKKTKRVIRLHSVALTNRPATQHQRELLAASLSLISRNMEPSGEITMDTKALKAALIAAGVELAEDANDETTLAAGIVYIGSSKAVPLVAVAAKLGLPTNSPLEVVQNRIGELQIPLAAICAKLGLPSGSSLDTVQARIGDLQVSVPAAEYKTVTDRLAKLEGIARDREGQEVLGYAIETAKINPNHEPSMVQYRVMAKSDPAAFRKLVDSMPPLYSVGRWIRNRTEVDDDSAANEERLIAKEIEAQKGDKKKALIALQEKLIEEQMAAGLRKDVAIARCTEMHPMIFGGSR